MPDGQIGVGTLLKGQDGGTPGVYSTIAEVAEIGPPELATADVKVTHHESPDATEEYIPGLKEGGDLELTVNYLPNHATHSAAGSGLLNLWKTRAVRNWQLVFPTTPTRTWTLSGYVKKFKPGTPMDDKMSAEIAIKVASRPTFS